MITKRGFLLLLLACVSYLAVLIADIPAFMEVTTVLLALLVASAAYTWLTRFGLGAQLLAPRQAVVGQQLSLRLRAYNRLPLPRFGMLWRITFTAGGAEGNFIWSWIDALRPFGERDVQVDVTCNVRGHHRAGPITIVYADPLGLFSCERTFKIDCPIEILPACVSLDAFPFIESGSGFRDPEKTMPTPGFSNDFYAIRPYMHGDSPRWIHWLSTVRMQKLMTRQFQAPVQRRVLLVLDCSRAPMPMMSGPDAFEMAVSAAASIVRFAAETEHEVGFMTMTRKSVMVQPAAGLENVRQMISQLARVRQDGPRGSYDLGRVLAAGVQSLIIVSSTPTPAFVEAMAAFSRQDLSLSIVIAAPMADGAKVGKSHPIRQLAKHGLAVCHVRNIQRLKHDLEHPASLPETMLPDWNANRSLRKVI